MPTPRPKNRRFLILSLLSITLAVAGYTLWTLARIDALGSAAYALRARTSGLERNWVAGAGVGEVYAEIAAIDAWLESNAPASAGIATPSQWERADDEIEATLRPLEPFYERVDRLLERPECRALVLAGMAAPERSSLLSNRNWTNLLVTRALLDAGRDQPAAAGRRIAQAIDLARLRDSGTTVGAGVRVAGEGIAIGALRRMLADDAADPSTLRAEVEPALARAGDPRLAAAAVAGELAHWSDQGRTIPRKCTERCAWLVRPYHFAWAKEELAAYVEVVEEALRQAGGAPSGALDSDGHLVLARTTIENEAFSAKTCLEIGLLARSRVALARVALALRAHQQAHGDAPATLDDLAYAFADGLPRDPCSASALRYEAHADEIVLGPPAFGAARELDAVQASKLLLRWSLAPNRP